jgi:GNAT superfamily N-acetyltransferase
MDGGQLSRLLKRLEDQGLIERLPSPADGRKQLVRLTDDGEAAYAALDQTSREEVGALLDAAQSPEAAVAAMRRLRQALEPGARSVVIRGPEPGDLGWLVERHGALYASEYGWDESFERLVAQIVADFDPAGDRAWIAEVDGTRAGVVLCVHHDDETAKLRTLLVEPSARGLGLGTSLVDRVIAHARNRGYATLTLWTNDVLHAARHVYEKAGFTLQSEAPHRAFGHDLVEQTWSLTLQPWTETH